MLVYFLSFSFLSKGFCEQSLAEKYYKEAIEYFKHGEYEKVAASCKKIIEIDPKYCIAYFAMGRAYTLLNNSQEAVSVFQKCLEACPEESDCYIGLGAAYRVKGDYPKGIAMLKKALEIAPDNPNNRSVYVALAAIYRKLKSDDECLWALEKAKGLDPDYGDVYVGFADYYRNRGQVENARENYRKAIAIYRRQGLENLAGEYEKILNKIEGRYVKIYLKSGLFAMGMITEETEEYVKLKDETAYGKVAGGSFMLSGGENKYDKKDIVRREIIQQE